MKKARKAPIGLTTTTMTRLDGGNGRLLRSAVPRFEDLPWIVVLAILDLLERDDLVVVRRVDRRLRGLAQRALARKPPRPWLALKGARPTRPTSEWTHGGDNDDDDDDDPVVFRRISERPSVLLHFTTFRPHFPPPPPCRDKHACALVRPAGARRAIVRSLVDGRRRIEMEAGEVANKKEEEEEEEEEKGKEQPKETKKSVSGGTSATAVAVAAADDREPQCRLTHADYHRLVLVGAGADADDVVDDRQDAILLGFHLPGTAFRVLEFGRGRFRTLDRLLREAVAGERVQLVVVFWADFVAPLSGGAARWRQLAPLDAEFADLRRTVGPDARLILVPAGREQTLHRALVVTCTATSASSSADDGCSFVQLHCGRFGTHDCGFVAELPRSLPDGPLVFALVFRAIPSTRRHRLRLPCPSVGLEVDYVRIVDRAFTPHGRLSSSRLEGSLVAFLCLRGQRALSWSSEPVVDNPNGVR